eukprot:gene29542-33358_t
MLLFYKASIYPLVCASIAIACSKYLIPSALPNAGRGIVAGIQFRSCDEIESNPTIPIPKELTQQTQLTHYVYGTGDDRFDMLMIGAGSIYNHYDPRTVFYTWKDEGPSDPAASLLPFTDYTKTIFHSVSNIQAGEEMLNHYGDHWFNRFDIAHDIESNDQSDHSPVHRFSLNDLKNFGHCISDTFVSPSPISNAGSGLVAGRNYVVGEIVAVSPVLLLPKYLVDQHTEESVLQNYCITVPTVDLVLLPISTGAMINHKASAMANVRMEWFDWSPAVEALKTKYPLFAKSQANNTLLRLSDKLAMSAEDLSTMPFAQLDIAYRATRPIAAGEEVLMDYGPAWESKWRQYIARMQAWKVKSSAKEQTQEFPLFREYIEAPGGMFPRHWTSTEMQQCSAEEETCP